MQKLGKVQKVDLVNVVVAVSDSDSGMIIGGSNKQQAASPVEILNQSTGREGQCERSQDRVHNHIQTDLQRDTTSKSRIKFRAGDAGNFGKPQKGNRNRRAGTDDWY